ncbi:MAG: hypothetical protein AAGD05_06925, partial [Bacteroidota bacterium]
MMKKLPLTPIVLLSWWLGASPLLMSQSPVDSLTRLLANSPDSLQVVVLHQLSRQYLNKIPDSALHYAQKAL